MVLNPPPFPEVLLKLIPKGDPPSLPPELVSIPPKCPPRPKMPKVVEKEALSSMPSNTEMPRAFVPTDPSQIPPPPKLPYEVPPVPEHKISFAAKPIEVEKQMAKQKTMPVLLTNDELSDKNMT